MAMNSLHDLYVEELRDLYSAENMIIKALPKMVKAASSEQLQNAFQEHLEETRGHVDRLEKICQKLDVRPRGKKCKAMEGLLEEGKELMEQEAEPAVKDAALIAAAQRVEHYEMAGYGCARTYAHILGEEEASSMLQQTLEEESAADKETD
jgi:ferritin-like metal-binding protein YciE